MYVFVPGLNRMHNIIRTVLPTSETFLRLNTSSVFYALNTRTLGILWLRACTVNLFADRFVSKIFSEIRPAPRLRAYRANSKLADFVLPMDD